MRHWLAATIVALAAWSGTDGASGQPPQATAGDDTAPLTKILFGSCIKQEQPMPIFRTILARQPQLFVFLGDNIYADTEDMEVMRAKYAKLAADPGFAKLRAACPVLATWDDHDFGVNDGGASYPKRREAQQLFVDFWKDPPNAARRQRPGVYAAQTFGPPGRRVQLILLDTRYFRGPLRKGPQRRVGGPYVPNDDPSVPMLGDAQWAWLREQLLAPAEIRVIASSIQFVASDAGQETWANLPRERARLVRLIDDTKADGVLFVSGDRHWSELSRLPGRPYPLYDFTTSSLNQPHPRGTPTDNRWRDLPTTYHEANFGELLIDWEQKPVGLQLRIVDLAGKIRISKQLNLEQISRSD